MKKSVIKQPYFLFSYGVCIIALFCFLLYHFAYLGNTALTIISTIFIFSGTISLIAGGFQLSGTSIWDDRFSAGYTKQMPLAVFFSSIISISLAIYTTVKMDDLSVERALNIVNHSKLVSVEGIVINDLTKHSRSGTYYEAVIVYRYKNKQYFRTISQDKDEFFIHQPLTSTFPVDYPKMIVIYGVLR